MTDVGLAPAPVGARRPRTAAGRQWHLHLLLGISALVMVVPFIWQILTAFKTPNEVASLPPTVIPASPTLGGFRTFFDDVPFWLQLSVSVTALVLRVIGQVLVASLAGYAFARLQFPFRRTLFAAFLLMLMVPSQLFLLGQFDIIKGLGLLDTVPALAIPGMFSAFGTFLMRQAFSTMPRDYEEAAKLDGASTVRTFWSIMLPMARPTIAALSVLTALYSWNDLLWPLIVTPAGDNRPLSVGLASMQGQFGTNYPALMAGALICSLPLVIAFVVMQRQFFAGIASSGLKG